MLIKTSSMGLYYKQAESLNLRGIGRIDELNKTSVYSLSLFYTQMSSAFFLSNHKMLIQQTSPTHLELNTNKQLALVKKKETRDRILFFICDNDSVTRPRQIFYYSVINSQYMYLLAQ